MKKNSLLTHVKYVVKKNNNKTREGSSLHSTNEPSYFRMKTKNKLSIPHPNPPILASQIKVQSPHVHSPPLKGYAGIPQFE